MNNKTCSKCGSTKMIDDFYVKSSAKSGRMGACKECYKKDLAEKKRLNPSEICNESKVCSKCDQMKSAENYTTDPNKKGGREGVCRQCRKISRDKRDLLKHNTPHDNLKICGRCKVLKSAESFCVSRHRNDGRNQYCRSCTSQVGKKYKENNAEKIAARHIKYRNENKDKIKDSQSKYASKNKGKYNAYAMKRISSKKNAAVDWADKQYIDDLYENCREAEQIFGNIGLNVKFQVDHIIPLQHDLVCGLHVQDNLQILSARDNQSKNNHFVPGDG